MYSLVFPKAAGDSQAALGTPLAWTPPITRLVNLPSPEPLLSLLPLRQLSEGFASASKAMAVISNASPPNPSVGFRVYDA